MVRLDPKTILVMINALELKTKWKYKDVKSWFLLWLKFGSNPDYNEIELTLKINYRALSQHRTKYNLKNLSQDHIQIIDKYRRLLLQGLLLSINYFFPDDLPFKLQELYNLTNEIYKPISPQKFSYKHDKIKVCYMSSDINANPVHLFISSLLLYYDRSKFEVFVLNTFTPDEISRVFQNYLDTNWVDVSKSDDKEIIQKIKNAEVDVLFDLSIHSTKNRIDVILQRPAPKIVSYLGYPNTLGIYNANTHRIVDNISDPSSSKHFYTEKLVKMNRCFLCYSPFRDYIVPIKYRIYNMKINVLILNKFEKYRNEHFLKMLSKLCLKNNDLQIYFACEKVRNRVIIKNVVPKNQCNFLQRKQNMSDYYDVINMFDMALDSFPYSGTTCSCNQMIMGLVPITLYDTNLNHVSNVSASIILHTDEKLNERFVCKNLDDYENKAQIEINRIRAGKNGELEKFRLEEEKWRWGVSEKFIKSMDPTDFMKEFEEKIIEIHNDT